MEVGSVDSRGWGVGDGVSEELPWLDSEGAPVFLHVVRTAPVSSDKDALNDKTGGYSAGQEWAWLLQQVVECRQEVRELDGAVSPSYSRPLTILVPSLFP